MKNAAPIAGIALMVCSSVAIATVPTVRTYAILLPAFLLGLFLVARWARRG